MSSGVATLESIRIDGKVPGGDYQVTTLIQNRPIALATAEMTPLSASAHSPKFGNFGTQNHSETEDKGEAKAKSVLVELKNIHKTYLLGIEGVPALRGVSLKIHRGEFVVIYGTSGGGKTSLLNLVGTIDKPTKGELFIGDTRIDYKTKDRTLANIRLSTLGFVFQTFNLISSMTALENVELPMTLKGKYSASDRRKLAVASLQRVGLSHRLDHFPTQLSGGEQQRVTIARAIANNPDVLLLDEPTGDLDSANTHRIIDLLIELNRERGMTMLMVTHDMYLKNFAHRVVWMRDGKIVKIEEISQEKQQHALKDLHLKILADKSEKQLNEPRPQPEGTHQTLRYTKVRQPKDYEVISFSMERHVRSNVPSTFQSSVQTKTPDSMATTHRRAVPIPEMVQEESIMTDPTTSSTASKSPARTLSPEKDSNYKADRKLHTRESFLVTSAPNSRRSGHRKSHSFTVPGYRTGSQLHEEMLVKSEKRDEGVFYESNDVIESAPDGGTSTDRSRSSNLQQL